MTEPAVSNGESNGHAAKSNALTVASNGKKLGGVTGKGFMPGKSGNPAGLIQKIKHQHLFGEHLRQWLVEKDWVRDLEGRKIKGAKKQPRLKTLINRLSEQKPEILLHYAYGKPVEMHQVEAAEGTEVEFIVRIHGKDMP